MQRIKVMTLSTGREIPIEEERGIGLFLKKVEQHIVRWLPGNSPSQLVQQQVYTWLKLDTKRFRYHKVFSFYPDGVNLFYKNGNPFIEFLSGKRRGEVHSLGDMGVFEDRVVNNILLMESRERYGEMKRKVIDAKSNESKYKLPNNPQDSEVTS